jgi:hypothetical protein
MMSRPPPTWAYGVMTVPQRRETLLPRTLEALRAGGFERPRLFVDGCGDPALYARFGLPVTLRQPAILLHGNWLLGLHELLIRQPCADHYALFQDDVVCVRNLRAYLERQPCPARCYANLFTFAPTWHGAPQPRFDNERQIAGRRGWVESAPLEGNHTYDGKPAQSGRGALALVFDRAGALTLLASRALLERPSHVLRGWRNIDGGVVTAMNQAGYREMIHAPSLVQHTGVAASTIGNGGASLALSFPGERFDALTLLQEEGAAA